MSETKVAVEFAVAVAKNGAIGAGGDLPWRMPSDLKHFRAVTMGKPVIMGRKTYAAIGRPLDGRDNVVVTRDKTFTAEGVHIAHSVPDGLEMARGLARECGADAVVVIGGEEIFRQTLKDADVIHLSLIDMEPQGDAFFPPLDAAQWEEIARRDFPRGEKDDASFSAITLRRR